MASTFGSLDSPVPFSWKDTIIGLVVATVASVVATAIAFVIVDAAGMIPDSVTIEQMNGDRSPIGIGEAIGATVTSWIIASVVFLLLRRFTAQPLKWFTIVAVVVCVVSFFEPPALIDDVPAKMIVGLDILHVVAAVSGVGALIAYLRSRS
ncbi:MAG: DUF6069 family protein [Thermomicrobiales bacterium]